MNRWFGLRCVLVALAVSFASLAAPLRAEDVPTYHFVFELDEEEAASRIPGEFDLDGMIESSIEVAKRRLNGASYQITNLGEGRIGLELTAVNAPKVARNVFGIVGDLDFLLVDDELSNDQIEGGSAPTGRTILPMADGVGSVAIIDGMGISGRYLTGARSSFDSLTYRPGISLSFDSDGKEQLAALTRANVGNRMAIVLDGKVLSAPTIQEPIVGGHLQISGYFTQQEANTLAVQMASGALPAPFKLVEERLVEPTP